MTVDPGICGFPCVIEARTEDSRAVVIKIIGSECDQIKKLSEQLNRMTLQELFMPVNKNPAFVLAQKFGCHASCVIPVAVLKVAEVAMGMALPKEVRIKFG